MAGIIKVACHCGGVSSSVTTKAQDDTVDITVCHCDNCRHVTGELLVSYFPIQPLLPAGLQSVTEYVTADGWTRLFCPTCGCHIFRTRESGEGLEWEVATGVLAGPATSDVEADSAPKIRFKHHDGVSSTRDGGSSAWLTEVDGYRMETLSESHTEDQDPAIRPPLAPDTLPASCNCGIVAFHITRPDATSLFPQSYLPDLTHAYCSTNPSIVANPSDKKWWLCPDGKYLAGTCACRTCRLVSGFEIQTWTFVPRSNIYFHVPSGESTTFIQLDFERLPAGILKSYASSPDVFREFCGKCGATVFWRGRLRPELIDVSVGLLRGEGARAEAWLEWWTKRVSFSEEAERGREGAEARRARALVSALEKGLKAWSGW